MEEGQGREIQLSQPPPPPKPRGEWLRSEFAAWVAVVVGALTGLATAVKAIVDLFR